MLPDARPGRFPFGFSVARRPETVADYPRMHDRMGNHSWRWAAIGFAIPMAAWLCYAGAKHEWASRAASSANPDDWLRAAQIEPGNAETWYRLGRYRQLDFENADLTLAVTYYRRAVELNPRSAYEKLDLAGALEMSGQDAEAEKYFRAAQDNYPASAEVAWRYGNFLLRQGRLPESYAQIHRAAVADPALIPLAVSRGWNSSGDASVVLDKILPPTPSAHWEALAFFLQAREALAAVEVWNRLLALKFPIEWTRVFGLIDTLISQDLFDQAETVWRQALVAGEAPLPPSAGGSLVFDGGFENEPTNGGFGWRLQTVPGAEFTFDTAERHSGARSLRIVFDGSQNLYFEQVVQYVLVQPRTRYRFEAFLRTDGISTNSGIGFAIHNPRTTGDISVIIPGETGTQPWTLKEAEFTTGPETRLLRIAIRRAPSGRIYNKLRGTVWVDDVALVPAGSPR